MKPHYLKLKKHGAGFDEIPIDGDTIRFTFSNGQYIEVKQIDDLIEVHGSKAITINPIVSNSVTIFTRKT